MEKAICLLSIVPVRFEKSDKAEIVTQLVFGDECDVLKRDGNWCQIRIAFDGYYGWIDEKQIHLLTEKDVSMLAKAQKYCSSEFATAVIINEVNYIALAGATVYVNTMSGFTADSFSYEILSGLTKGGNGVVVDAHSFLGVPYLWGGKTHFGIDCSGFVQQVFKMNNVVLPRDAYQQEKLGSEISFQDVQAGDLAYFSNDGGKVIHVGLCLADDKIIHAHGEVRIDRLDEKGIILNAKLNSYSHKLSSIKRLG